MQKGYIRKEIYSIEDILSRTVPVNIRNSESRADFDGDLIRMNSHRYELFKEKGVKCITCDIEGKYFAKERDINAKSYHFNLYAINGEGKEVLMTKDHIIRKREGGIDHISNYQTMCVICNNRKG